MNNRRVVGGALLLVLGFVSLALDVNAYLGSTLNDKMLLLNIGVAAFGLYVFGAIFFDYPVTFRGTISPTDPWDWRVFNAGVGLVFWGLSVWGALKS